MYQKAAAPVPLSLLVVEDHALLRQMFTEAFHKVYTVNTAPNVEKGWSLYLCETPHIVFLDIGLPDASGHSLARRIKKHNSATYVIMVTASDSANDLEEAALNDADGFIIKPFDRKKISVFIDRYVTAHPCKRKL